MANPTDEEADAVLSDVEEGEESPVPIGIKDPSPENISVERFKELLVELDRERQARIASENSKSELQGKFDRLKALAHEAIKKRDECARQRDEALREKEEFSKVKDKVSAELGECNRAKDEISREREEFKKQFEEAVKARESLKLEMETSAHMLVTGIEKISGKVSNFKNFSTGGLPRSQKYTGLPAVAYGVIKRANEIVEELVRQIDSTAKSRNEAREIMEQRNYEIAIEVSQLEATISGLREEVEKKSSNISDLEKLMAEKDENIAVMDREKSEKINFLEKEVAEFRHLAGENDDKLKSLQSKIGSHRPLLFEQLNYVSRIHDQLYDVIKIVDCNNLDHSELSDSLFLPKETDIEENIRASLAGMESVYELARIVAENTKDLIDKKCHEIRSLEGKVSCLVKEKEHIGSLLRSALSKRIAADPSSKSELFQVAENKLRETGIHINFGEVLGDGKVTSKDEAHDLGTEENEIYSLAGALENIVKTSQLEIIELRHSMDELRAESILLKERIEAQAKELSLKIRRIEELEEKERVANESVEGLMMDIAAAEEEITRWKVAAEQEAAAGRAVEEELNAQLASLKHELEEAKQAMLESEKKLKFKEETAAAAMAARDAAEKSLKLADSRASRLRDRVEELSRKLEEAETREDGRGQNVPRYVCWPWQWLGLDSVGVRRTEPRQHSSNEMELSEPLL